MCSPLNEAIPHLPHEPFSSHSTKSIHIADSLAILFPYCISLTHRADYIFTFCYDTRCNYKLICGNFATDERNLSQLVVNHIIQPAFYKKRNRKMLNHTIHPIHNRVEWFFKKKIRHFLAIVLDVKGRRHLQIFNKMFIFMAPVIF